MELWERTIEREKQDTKQAKLKRLKLRTGIGEIRCAGVAVVIQMNKLRFTQTE